MRLRRRNYLRLTLIVAILCAPALGDAEASDTRQCAVADALETRISAALQVPAPCLRDDQCYVAHLGCPFPCASALGTSQRGMLETAVKDFRESQATGKCPACESRCDELETQRKARCVANRCILSIAK
jgi:hypothetical protein